MDLIYNNLRRFYLLVKRHGGLYRFIVSPVVLSDSDIEKRERLVQTYLIVFGLFLSYDFDVALKSSLMECFIIFVNASLAYYSLLIRPFLVGLRITYDFFAVMIGVLFSYAFLTCMLSFSGRGAISDSFYLLFKIDFIIMMAFMVAYPLLV